MKKKIIMIAILLALIAAISIPSTRSIKLITKSGESIELYSGSYALVIGVSDYTAGWPDLPGVKRDIEEVSSELKKQGFTVSVIRNPDRQALVSGIEQFINKNGNEKGNRLLVYFAGHGHTEKLSYGEEMGYIVPADAPNPNRDRNGFLAKAVDMQQIEVFAKRIQAKHALFVFDSCFSGSIFALSRAVPEAISYKTAEPVRQFITSGSMDETVPDKSLFKSQFLSGIRGEADSNSDGYVTGTELGEYLQNTVANYSKGSQHPQYGKIRNPNLDKGDYVFSVTISSSSNDSSSIPSYTANLPPATGDVDLSDLKAESERTRLAKQKELNAWSSWQGKFKQTIEEAKKLDGDSNISASSKKTSWDRILKTYNSDNPYSADDENLRKYVKERINYWTKEASKPATSSSSSVSGSYYSSGDSSDPAYSNMARISGGNFEMGSNDGESDEKPVHTVQLSSFYMDKYEVTNGEYKKCVDEGSCRAPSESKSYTRSSYYGDSRYENYPVINVSWDDARKYCQWKGKRLPTEAEWEYAARGGLEGARYPNGDTINCGDANFARWNGPGETSKCVDSGGKDNDTQTVGSYAANGYGLYDMSGNVWEWVSDWYEEKYYKSSPPRDPQGPSNGEYRVVRGGSWGINATSSIRVSGRAGSSTAGGDSGNGFRCAR